MLALWLAVSVRLMSGPRHANDDLIIPAWPPGLRAPSSSSSCASRYVRSTVNLTAGSFAWQVTILSPSFPLWQCQKAPKMVSFRPERRPVFSHRGMGSSQCGWKGPSLELEPWGAMSLLGHSTKPKNLTVAHVLPWLKARPLYSWRTGWCLVRSIVHFFH